LRELPGAVPAEVLLALEPEELGAKLLFLVRSRQEHMFHPGGMITELGGGMTFLPRCDIHITREPRFSSH
jgi:hypothetical protein